MSTDRGESMGGAGVRRGGTANGNASDTDDLSMRVVEYPDAPDRCTIYPPGLGDQERMTHWISADREAFVSLELRR